MAFASHQMTTQIRPNNKEPVWTGANDDLFEQYIDADGFDFEFKPLERSSSDEQIHSAFDFSGASDHSFPVSTPDQHWGTSEEDTDEFWAKNLRALDTASFVPTKETDQTYRYQAPIPHRESKTCNPDFLSLGGFPSPHIQSPPSPELDRRTWRKAEVVPPSTYKAINNESSFRKAVKKCRSTPNMMNPSRYRADFKSVWAEKAANADNSYGLQVLQPGAPLSPPLSARMAQTTDYENSAACGDASSGDFQPMSAFDEQISPLSHHFSKARIQSPLCSPRSKPSVDPHRRYKDTSSTLQDIFNFREPTFHALPTAPQSSRSSWNQQPSNHLDADIFLSPDYNPWTAVEAGPMQRLPQTAANGIMIPMSTMPASSQMRPPQPYTTIHQPVPNLAHSSLLTSYNPSTLHSTFALDPSLDAAIPPVPRISPYYLTATQTQIPLQAPVTHRGRRAASPSPSRSPSASPPTPSSRSLSRSRARSRTRATSSQRRQPSRHHRRAKSGSYNKTSARAQSMPRSPGPGTSSGSAGRANVGGGGFVNFTPFDSAKLLTGVAPSGSSKTKARREKEASDRRRKLSQAAVRAVVEAGGNLESLRGAGLIV